MIPVLQAICCLAMILVFASNNPAISQCSEFYGMTSLGGEFNNGAVFKIDESGNFNLVHSFDILTQAKNAYGDLCEASNGKFYGMTAEGGVYNKGILFEWNADSNVYRRKLDFDGALKGSLPKGSLVRAGSGKLYGLTSRGGTNDMGVIFEFDPVTNIFTKKLDFNGTGNGSHPNGSLFQADNGKLYGMTLDGGDDNMGVIFEWDPVISLCSKIVDFDGDEYGKYPYGSLIQADNGLLYGMCSEGGVNNAGVLFELDPENNACLKKIDFSGPEMGMNPYGSLLQETNGNLVGMTRKGGARNEGVIFEYDPVHAVFQKRIEFNFRSMGRYPYGSLIQGDNGKIYGMTWGGGWWGGDSAHPPGPEGKGVLFEWDPVTNVFTLKVDFGYDGNSYSQSPRGSLVRSEDGRFFGMTSSNIFEWDPLRNIIRHNVVFKESGDYYQNGSILVMSNGKILGVYSGGGPNETGILFEINPENNSFQNKVTFNGKGNGSYGYYLMYESNSLIQAKSGKIYGTTPLGGIDNSGVLFEWDPVTDHFVKKMDFAGAETGKNPCGGLLQADNGKFYGMTRSGGMNGYGTLFEWDPSLDTFTIRLDFESSTLTMPTGSLIQGKNGKLYGCRKANLNSLDKAILFEWDLQTGFYKEIVDIGPKYPYGQRMSSPVEEDNGKLYFTYESLYEWDPVKDSLILKHDYTTAEGYYPVNSIIKTSNGKILGETIIGGLKGNGTIYEYDITNEYYKKLFDFGPSAGYPTISNLAVYINHSIESVIVCDSIVSPSGRYTWISSGIFSDTIPNATGCDSVITMNLTVNHSTFSSLDTTCCYSCISPSGKYIWKEDGEYTDTIPNTKGCDSIITFHLIVNHVNTNVVQQGYGLQAAISEGKYQWINCLNNTLLSGETSQSFSAQTPGNYAVIISENDCSDTSGCFTILATAFGDNSSPSITLYPNPSTESFTINLGQVYRETFIIISNPVGEKILQEKFLNTDKINISEAFPPGLYIVTVNTGEKDVFLKVLTCGGNW